MAVEQLGREDARTLLAQRVEHRLGQAAMHGLAVDLPQDRLLVGRRGGGEMERDQRGVGPVEQPRRQPVMLGERQPVPGGGAGRRAVRVFAEAAQQVALELGEVRVEPGEAVDVAVARARQAAEDGRRMDDVAPAIPPLVGDGIVELPPGADGPDRVHCGGQGPIPRAGRQNTTSCRRA